MKFSTALPPVIFSLFFPALCLAKDYGDAPSSYGTKDADQGPSHGQDPNLFMGNLAPDQELDGIPDAAALGDDLGNIDDEDALNAASLIFLEGDTYKLVVNCTNQTGNLAKLGVWVDWNRDGVFKTDGTEFASADVPSAGLSQQIVVNLPAVPNGVVGGNPAGEISFLRLRLTTDLPALSAPTGSAADGEVEDWQIQIFENFDYGDLPDIGPGTGIGNYRTNLADNGPRHKLGRPVYLGQEVDGEFNAQPLATALGDDNAGNSADDEDGVSVSQLVAGLTATFTATATNQTTDKAVLLAQVDLNQNGSFADPGETQSEAVLAGSTNLPVSFDFAIPGGFPTGSVFATRFRISTDSDMLTEPNQATFTDGEVEDYFFVSTGGLDWGDLPDRYVGERAGRFNSGDSLPDYRTLAADNGPNHVIIPGLSIANDSGTPDANIDPDADGQPTPTADGDDNDGNHDDLSLMSVIVSQVFNVGAAGADHSSLDIGLVINHAVNNTTGSNATFYAFLDANRDGDFDDAGEVQTTVIPGDGSVTFLTEQFNFTIPWPGVLSWTESFALRCRISSDPNLGPNGPAPDGEVQDDIVTANFMTANPRPQIVDPENPEGNELFLLDGEDVTAALNNSVALSSSDFAPASVSQIANPTWSLLLGGTVVAGPGLSLNAATINQLGLGAHPITLSFTDSPTGDLYVIRFFLRVIDLPGYSAWVIGSGLDSLNSRPELDADADGVSNLLEFAIGSEADLSGSIPSLVTTLSGGTGSNYLGLSYPRLNGGVFSADGYRVGELVYREQGSLDLVNWQEVVSSTANPAGLPMPLIDYQWASFRLGSPISSQDQGFLRVQVELEPEEHP